MKYDTIQRIKQLVEYEPKSFYHGDFLLTLIEEIEELYKLFNEAKVRKWIREGDYVEANKWIRKMRHELGIKEEKDG